MWALNFEYVYYRFLKSHRLIGTYSFYNHSLKNLHTPDSCKFLAKTAQLQPPWGDCFRTKTAVISKFD